MTTEKRGARSQAEAVDQDRSLVAPSDIAEMVQPPVTRAAVSNWRKRKPDFPPVVGGTPGKPLFDRSAVVTWLGLHGHEIRKDDGENLVWAALNALRGIFRPEEAPQFLLSLACARKLAAEPDGSPGAVWEELRTGMANRGLDALAEVARRESVSDPQWGELIGDLYDRHIPGPHWVPVCDVLTDVNVDDLGDVVDSALTRGARSRVRDGLESGFVGSRTSTLLANLAMSSAPSTLYDPACGLGGALVAAAKTAKKPIRLIGHEVHVEAARQARQRCFLHNLDIEVVTGDVLASDPDPALRVSSLLAEPPFGVYVSPGVHLGDPRWQYGFAPKSSGDTLWLQHALAHLAEGGRAFVITPAASLGRSGADRNIRTGMLRDGCVEAVVALPPRMLPHVSAELALWVLRPAHDADRAEVRFIDATGVDDVEAQLPEWFCAGTFQDVHAPNEAIDVRDLLAADADLSVQRWVQAPGPDAAELVADYQASRATLKKSISALQHPDLTPTLLSSATGARVVTMRELIEQNVLEVTAGRADSKDLPDGLQDLVIKSGMLGSPLPEAPTAHNELPPNLKAHLTSRGDILVSTQHAIRAVVDLSGGHLAGTGVQRIRVLQPDQLSPHYLAATLSGSWNSRFLTGQAMKRADIRLCEIPLVGAEAQADLTHAADAAAKLAEEGRVVAEQSLALRNSILNALRFNVDLTEGVQ